jgi:hypothetical protein
VEKVLKNHFFNKFHGIFRGKSLSVEKNVRKIGPGVSELHCFKQGHAFALKSKRNNGTFKYLELREGERLKTRF